MSMSPVVSLPRDIVIALKWVAKKQFFCHLHNWNWKHWESERFAGREFKLWKNRTWHVSAFTKPQKVRSSANVKPRKVNLEPNWTFDTTWWHHLCWFVIIVQYSDITDVLWSLHHWSLKYISSPYASQQCNQKSNHSFQYQDRGKGTRKKCNIKKNKTNSSKMKTQCPSSSVCFSKKRGMTNNRISCCCLTKFLLCCFMYCIQCKWE